MSLKKQTFILTSKNKCSGNSFLFLRFVTSKRDRANLDRRKKKKKRKKELYNNNRIKGNIFQLYVLIMLWLICFKGQERGTKPSGVWSRFKFSSLLYLYTTHIYISPFSFLEKHLKCCVYVHEKTYTSPLIWKMPILSNLL